MGIVFTSFVANVFFLPLQFFQNLQNSILLLYHLHLHIWCPPALEHLLTCPCCVDVVFNLFDFSISFATAFSFHPLCFFIISRISGSFTTFTFTHDVVLHWNTIDEALKMYCHHDNFLTKMMQTTSLQCKGQKWVDYMLWNWSCEKQGKCARNSTSGSPGGSWWTKFHHDVCP